MSPSDYLNAPDVFVSYSHTDAPVYVNKLAAKLSAKSLYCIIDQWHSEPGQRVPKSLLRLVKKSGILVVVGSKGAQHSKAMEDEIRVFRPNKRTIIPVDTDGSIRNADWWKILDGLTPVKDHSALPELPKEPAPEVVDHILSAVDFVTRDQRLKKAARTSIRVLAGALTVFILAAAGTAWWVRDANAKVSKAQKDQRTAEAAQITAVNEKNAAVTARDQALVDRTKAEQDRANFAGAAKEARAAALAADHDAKLAEGRATDANRLEARTRLVAEARSSLTARDPDRAFQRAREALEKGDGEDARLLLAEAWNAGIQAGQVELGGDVAVFEVNPVREGEFVSITPYKRLQIHRHGSPPVVSDEYRFLNVKYDPSGNSIYAVGSLQEKPPTEDGRNASYSSWLIHYDLNLKPLAEPLKLGPFPLGNIPSACELRSADSMRIDGSRLLFAGSCGPYDVRPVFGWVDLREWRLKFNVDPAGEWPTYRGQLAPMGPSTLVVDSPRGFFLLDLQSSERQRISDRYAIERLLAASPDGKLFVAASTTSNQVWVFHRSPAGKWHAKTYELDDPDGIESVAFVSATRVVLAQKLGSVWLLDVDPYYDDHRLAVSFEGDRVDWREPAVRKLGAHDGTVTGFAVSPDSKWIATAAADNTIRLWSASGATERLFRTGLSNAEILRWSKDSRSLYVVDTGGIVHIYRPEAAGGFTLRANPLSDRPEPRLPIWLRIVAQGPLRPPVLEERYGYIRKLEFDASGDLAVDTYDNIHTEWDGAYQARYTTFAPASSAATPPPRPVSSKSAWESSHQVVPNESDGTVDIYDQPMGHAWLRLVPSGPKQVKFDVWKSSPGGTAVALRLDASNGTICVVDSAHRRVRVHHLHYSTENARYELSDDGALVVAHPNGRLEFSDADSGTLREGGHGNVLPYVDISPDGMWFATAGVRDGTVRLWSFSGDYSEYKLPYRVEHLAFSTTGRELVAGSASSIHAWAVPTAEVLRKLGISPAQPLPKSDALAGSHLAESGLAALLYDQTTGAWDPLPEQESDREAQPTSSAKLARVLVSDSANPEERLAAARSLARMQTGNPQAIAAAVDALGTALKYPAVARAVIDYIKSVRRTVQPILLTRLESEQDPQVQSTLIWAAGQVYFGLPEVQAAARRGLTSQNPDLRLVSTKVVADSDRSPQALTNLLAAFLARQESSLVTGDDVRRLLVACEPKVVAQALQKLSESEEVGAIRLLGRERFSARPIFQQLIAIPLRPDARAAYSEVASLDSEDRSAEWRRRTLDRLKSDSGTESCRIGPANLLHGLTPGPEPEMPEIAQLVLEKAEKDPTSEICLNALGEVAPDGGIPLTRVMALLERVSANLEPLSYGITDVILEDLEDTGVPADVIQLLRSGAPDEWRDREQFEKEVRKKLGEETWAKFGAQIAAATGKPRTKSCDLRYNPTAAAIGAIGAYGTAASEADQTLRAMAEKYANCTDIVPAIAKALNEISGVSKHSSLY